MMRFLHILMAAACLTPAARLAAQSVVVAPATLFIDHRGRHGSIELVNTGTEPVEVSVSTMFGYPTSDAAGHVEIRMFESPDATAPSAAKWITAYPRQVTIHPGGRQRIRLLANPPAQLTDGEYWTRLIVVSKGGSVVVNTPATAGSPASGAQPGRTAAALLYRKGKMQTGLQLSGLDAKVVGDSLQVGMRLERQGNAAFLGMARIALVDAQGKTVSNVEQQVAVYYDLSPRFTLPLRGVAAGSYTVRLTLDNVRDDVSGAAKLPFAAMTQTLPVSVP